MGHYLDHYQTDELKVGNFRRTGHSIKRWGSKFKRGSSKSSSAAGAVYEGASQASAGFKVAQIAGATGVVAAVATGPIAGGIFAVIGFGLLAKSMYSNRDKAHRLLAKYTDSFIHSNGPHLRLPPQTSKDKWDAVGGAAAALVLDQEHLKRHSLSKFATAHGRFESFISYLKGNATDAQKKARVAKAEKTGGEIFEYMRRLVHYGNYLQAYTVIATLQQNKTILPKLDDYQALRVNGVSVVKIREAIEEAADLIEKYK